MNKVMLIGRVTNDLEIKKAGETSVVNFSLATNRSYKTKSGEKVDEAEFHRCVAFANLADVIGQYVKKGAKIFLEGRLRTRQWEDQSGNKRYTTEIITEKFEFCESSKSSSEAGKTEKVDTATNEEVPF